MANVTIYPNGSIKLPSYYTPNKIPINNNSVLNDGRIISTKVAKRIKNKTASFIMHSIKKGTKSCMFTFTTPKNINHKTFSDLVIKFIRNLQKQGYLGCYMGVFELQKRGVIHAHFLIETFQLNVLKFQNVWNNLIGYTSGGSLNIGTRKKNGKKIWFLDLNQPYKLVNYLSKYLSKSNELIYCRLYLNSYSLNKIANGVCCLLETAQQKFGKLNYKKYQISENVIVTTYFFNLPDIFQNIDFFFDG